MATVSIGGGLEEKISAIAAAGFHSIELLDDDLRRSGMTPEECAHRCADLGLTIELYQPFRRAEGVPPGEFREVLSRFHGELDVMRRLSAESILVVSNTDTDADGNRDLSAAQLAILAAAAAEHGMMIMFEALAWGTHISRTADAWDTIQRASHPNLALVVDTFHMNARGEDAGTLAELPPYAIGFLQVADAPRLPMDLLTWSRNHRCFPGEGEFDLPAQVAAAISSGYRGPLSLEIFNPGYRERPADDAAKAGADALRRLIAEVTDASRPVASVGDHR
ncbi:sugar phosphate isomerase/epimerase family protein [Micromonospora craniellae]|nr:sugar phosphate isomerase/epimerase [Micromonospora craniellae]QOC94760.1 sugar phosphate isomerase/epimerase [Micromonospora craniellae]